jgi:hypothetical protein
MSYYGYKPVIAHYSTANRNESVNPRIKRPSYKRFVYSHIMIEFIMQHNDANIAIFVRLGGRVMP